MSNKNDKTQPTAPAEKKLLLEQNAAIPPPPYPGMSMNYATGAVPPMTAVGGGETGADGGFVPPSVGMVMMMPMGMMMAPVPAAPAAPININVNTSANANVIGAGLTAATCPACGLGVVCRETDVCCMVFLFLLGLATIVFGVGILFWLCIPCSMRKRCSRCRRYFGVDWGWICLWRRFR